MIEGRTADLEIESVVEAEGWQGVLGVDPEALAERIIRACAEAESVGGAVAVLFTDDATLRSLNRQWRGKDAPTNVLSFPAAPGIGDQESIHLGDLALAMETVTREAASQGKTVEAHTAHLIAHGFLHLLGYDHEHDAEAADMEGRERAIVAALGYPDPYDSGDASARSPV